MAGSSVNVPNPKLNTTIQVFDNFYNFQIEVEANEYDVVNSYFKSIFGDKQIAQNFTVSLFRVAYGTNVSVLTLLDQIAGQDSITLTQTMAYFLNGIRSPATLLGVNSPVVPNVWAARNVLL